MSRLVVHESSTDDEIKRFNSGSETDELESSIQFKKNIR